MSHQTPETLHSSEPHSSVDLAETLPFITLPPDNRPFITYEDIKDHLSQSPALGTMFCKSYQNSHELCTFFRKCNREMRGPLRYVVALDHALFSGLGQFSFNYEILFCLNVHANLQGLALLASLMLKYFESYVEMNDEVRNEECEDKIIRSFVEHIKSLIPLELYSNRKVRRI
jgi:hypothetical protein